MNKIRKDESGFSVVELLLVLILLAVIGGVGYMVYHNSHKTKTAVASTVSDNANKSSSKDVSTAQVFQLPSGWTWYTNDKYNFKFAYPDAWGTPQVYISPGVTAGMEYEFDFSPGPAYDSSNGYTVSRNQITLEFSSDNYNITNKDNETVTDTTGKSAIKTSLDSINSDTNQGGIIVSHNSSSYVSLITSTSDDSTATLQENKIVSLPSLDVSGALDTYMIYDSPTTCSLTGLSSNSEQWCMTPDILSQLDNMIISIQSI